MRNKDKSIRIAVYLVLAMMLFLSACGAKADITQTISDGTTSIMEDDLSAMPETLPPIRVEMPEYKLDYPGKLKDVIVMNALEGENALEFKVKLTKGETTIFTLRYNTDAGELVTVVEDEQGNRIPVAFEMASLPENLSEEDRNTFFEAQDAVNDIVASLVLS